MLRCPECGSTNFKVIDSRNEGISGSGLKRRRLCISCGNRWTTYEISVGELKKLEGGEEDHEWWK